MARNKSPRKRKPGKSGYTASGTAISRPRYPNRFLVSTPPQSDFGDVAEFFYDTPEETISTACDLALSFSSTLCLTYRSSILSVDLNHPPTTLQL
ncbi:Uncharacterised protein [Yersinia kristensenii]|nr:Uncharacterised protein [Yersinia kristensenii]